MEPKDKVHSTPLDEEKNSAQQAENVEKMELNDAAEVNQPADELNEKALPEDESTEVKSENAEIPKQTEEQHVEKAEEQVEEVEVEQAGEETASSFEEKSEDQVDEIPETATEEQAEEQVEETAVSVEEMAEEQVEETPVAATEEQAEEQVEETTATSVEEKAEEQVEATPVAAVEEKADEQSKAELESPAEETVVVEKIEKSGRDFGKMTEVELINSFKALLEKNDYLSIQSDVDAIRSSFYKKHKIKVQEQRKQFLEAGGFEEEFKAEPDPYEKDLKDLMGQFRQLKAQHNKEVEKDKEENLKIKYQIIEEIKDLVNRKESINKTFQDFKVLQQRWRDIGLVPQASVKDLWENYHHHVENFYDYIKINKELRDLDLKKNMEEKIGLCERAEALLLEPSVIKAFNALQKLHDAWREIGPAPTDKKEEIWERFRDATNLINKKHQDFFENRKKNQKKNLETKVALCEKVEELIEQDYKNHKVWEEKSKEVVEMQKYWRTIGFAPKKDNNLIYERFRKTCDSFFDKKREFYAKHKEIQSNNLQLKIDLCVQAEALKESTDWKKTSDEYIAIQKRWKEIGPVPRKHSDVVWRRFRSACDYFFKKKSAFFNTIDKSQVENLKLKKELIEEISAFKPTGDDAADFEQLRAFQNRWNEIGHVPFKEKNAVQQRYREAINKQFDQLRVEDRDRNLMKFKNKVSGLSSSSRGQNKMYNERDKNAGKLKQLESDLLTLQNNVGFFANSKNAEALINDVNRKIEQIEEQIEYLKDKIRIVDEMDNDED